MRKRICIQQFVAYPVVWAGVRIRVRVRIRIRVRIRTRVEGGKESAVCGLARS